jgi:hypothetical protein
VTKISTNSKAVRSELCQILVTIAIVALVIGISAASRAQDSGEGYWLHGFGDPGMNGQIWSICGYGDDLIAVGLFTSAGGVACNNVARWDGSTWSPLGGGLNGQVNAVAVFNGLVVVGGFFTSASNVPATAYIAAWDGSSWQSIGGGVNSVVYSLYVFEGDLIAGGGFTRAGSTDVNYVSRWDGQAWSGMGAGFTQGEPLPTVWCFAEFQGSLIAGGRFSHSGSTVLNRVARWNGDAWEPLGLGVGGGSVVSVYEMCVFHEQLVVGGYFTMAGGVASNNLARWNGTSWLEFDPGIAGPSDVTALYVYADELYVGGLFSGVVGVPDTAYLARWSGGEWDSVAHEINGIVDKFVAFGTDLLLCGGFTQINEQVENRIARYNSSRMVLQVDDAADDQGGLLNARWNRHRLDDSSLQDRVLSYELQRLGGFWVTVATVAAVEADSYSVQIETDDIYVVGDPEPYSVYRVVARTADLGVFFVSEPDSGYSIDNIVPPQPIAQLLEFDDVVVILWETPDIPDFNEACVYRGTSPNFVPEEPIACSATPGVVDPVNVMVYYRVRYADIHGNLSEFSEAVHPISTAIGEVVPAKLELLPCYPNPFNPRTTVSFTLPAKGHAEVAIYDAKGQMVARLVDEALGAGPHTVDWDGRDAVGASMPSGTYFCRLTTSWGVETRKMTLVR